MDFYLSSQQKRLIKGKLELKTEDRYAVCTASSVIIIAKKL